MKRIFRSIIDIPTTGHITPDLTQEQLTANWKVFLGSKIEPEDPSYSTLCGWLGKYYKQYKSMPDIKLLHARAETEGIEGVLVTLGDIVTELQLSGDNFQEIINEKYTEQQSNKLQVLLGETWKAAKDGLVINRGKKDEYTVKGLKPAMEYFRARAGDIKPLPESGDKLEEIEEAKRQVRCGMLRPPEPLLTEFWPTRGTISSFAATQGTGKSVNLFKAFLDGLNGQPIFGYYKPVYKPRVYYIQSDCGASHFMWRIAYPLGYKQSMTEDFTVYNTPSSTEELAEFNLIEHLEKMIDQGYEVIVLDNLTSLCTGSVYANNNNQRNGIELAKRLKKLAIDRQIAMVFVEHIVKPVTSGMPQPVKVQDILGSTSKIVEQAMGLNPMFSMHKFDTKKCYYKPRKGRGYIDPFRNIEKMDKICYTISESPTEKEYVQVYDDDKQEMTTVEIPRLTVTYDQYEHYIKDADECNDIDLAQEKKIEDKFLKTLIQLGGQDFCYADLMQASGYSLPTCRTKLSRYLANGKVMQLVTGGKGNLQKFRVDRNTIDKMDIDGINEIPLD